MRRYTAESRKIFSIFGDFSPRVEGLSLDEAFLDLSGTERALGTPCEVGERIRERVRAELDLAVSVGIAPVKMVAKIASAAAKPDGLLEIHQDAVRDFLAPLPVRWLFGVGPVAESRLREAGFATLGELAAADRAQLESLLGEEGLQLARLARGEDVRGVEPLREAVSYSEENTFASDVVDRQVLEATLLTHAEAVARRLRRDGLQARTVVLKVRLARRRAEDSGRYPLRTRRRTLEAPTDDGDCIAREGRRLLGRLERGEPIRLLGVGVTNLVDAGQEQLALFASPGTDPRRSELNRAMDRIRDRFGSNAVVRGSRGEAQRAGLSLQVKRGDADDDPA